MDKILYSKEDIDFLLGWRDKNKEKVRKYVCPIKAIKIISMVNGTICTCVRNGNIINVGVTLNGKHFGKIVAEYLNSGLYRVDEKCTSKIFTTDMIQSIMTVYASTMALLAYGNETTKPSKQIIHKSDDSKPKDNKKNKKKQSKSKPSGITYVLRRDSKNAVIIPHGKHRSPQGTFNVRGHFRHYRDGKIVWIEEYSKGRGDKKSKTYKL